MSAPCATSCCSSESGNNKKSLPVAIIGAGPVGLAAAMHLIARGLEPVILEAGTDVGAAVQAWGHVRMFSPWRYNIDKAARAALEAAGWQAPNEEAFPRGCDLIDAYLRPLAALPEIASRLHLKARVTDVARGLVGKVRSAGRKNAPFDVRYIDAEGDEQRLLAGAVIDATGTWGQHGWAGASGLPALGERAAGARIVHGVPDVLGADRARFASRKTMVVGSGDSALGLLIELARLGTEAPGTSIVWAVRNRDLTRALGGGATDQLPERGALGTRVRQLVDLGIISAIKPFAVEKIIAAADALAVIGADEFGTRSVSVDEMVVCTGFRPDISILRELRLDLDPALDCPRALAPLIDPNLHSCGTVRPHGAEELEQPEPGLFIVGMKSYGRAPTFLLATGYEQVRSVAAYLAGDVAASRLVELDLPQTGVCSSNLVEEAAECCGNPAITAPSCCAPASAASLVGVGG